MHTHRRQFLSQVSAAVAVSLRPGMGIAPRLLRPTLMKLALGGSTLYVFEAQASPLLGVAALAGYVSLLLGWSTARRESLAKPANWHARAGEAYPFDFHDAHQSPVLLHSAHQFAEQARDVSVNTRTFGIVKVHAKHIHGEAQAEDVNPEEASLALNEPDARIPVGKRRAVSPEVAREVNQLMSKMGAKPGLINDVYIREMADVTGSRRNEVLIGMRRMT